MNGENLKSRQEYNLLILERIKAHLELYPEIRFGQMLSNLNIVKYKFINNEMTTRDPFYEESEDTYNQLT